MDAKQNQSLHNKVALKVHTECLNKSNTEENYDDGNRQSF